MNSQRNYCSHRKQRTGGAVVEAALVLPVLIILTLGVIDIAQYISLAQVVFNASRESARVASRSETDSASEVESAAKQYFRDMFPNVSESQLDEAITITLRDSNNDTVTNLSTIETGARLSMYLKFDFRTIRWLNGIDYWSGSADQATTIFRRE